MKLLVGAALAAAAVCLAGAAWAEPYKDWTPNKGVWEITAIHVDPNHIDDYLTGLRASWGPGNEIAKKHGVVDQWQILVRTSPGGTGPNVLLAIHHPSMAVLEPDKARDQAIEQEGYAQMSKEKGNAMVAGYEKYRTFVGDGLWQSVDLAK